VTGLLSPELLARLRDEVMEKHAQQELSRAGIGRGDDHMQADNIRRDKTEWIEGGTLAQQLLLARLEEVRLEMNRRLMLGLFATEAHYAAYPPGAFYARHSDSFHGAKNRLLSLVMYLNPDWQEEDGGLLALYADEQSTTPFARLLPEYGHAVLFLSEEIPHEVTLTARTRYSIAAWFHCRRSEEIHHSIVF
jgi:SM-20-related protein